jgi:hypothetical protein
MIHIEFDINLIEIGKSIGYMFLGAFLVFCFFAYLLKGFWNW